MYASSSGALKLPHTKAFELSPFILFSEFFGGTRMALPCIVLLAGLRIIVVLNHSLKPTGGAGFSLRSLQFDWNFYKKSPEMMTGSLLLSFSVVVAIFFSLCVKV